MKTHWFVKDFADGFIHFDNEADARREVEATGALLLVAFEPERTVRHVKRGSCYNVLGDGELQLSSCTVAELIEGDKLTVYRGEDGKLWLRFPYEFNDGRFEDLTYDGEAGLKTVERDEGEG